MEDCVFCKIVKGELPCHQIYQDQDFLAFLDINPVTPGHVLLIPKDHYRWVYDLPNFGDYWQVAQKIALSIKKSDLKPDFISFITMGNEVPHAHIHIIPRSANDHAGPVLSALPHFELTEEKFKEIQNTIINSIEK